MQEKEILGIDVGASGIKGAIVDTATGTLLSERFRVATPSPSHPEDVALAFAEVVRQFGWKKSVGCGFPALIKKGVAHTAANIEKSWIGVDVARLFSKACTCEVLVRNDADLAGLAEMRYGAGKGRKGNIILITIGSGLGSALFTDGKLVPNTELGHLYLRNSDVIVERFAADSIRKKEELTWEEWGERFNQFLLHLEQILAPDLIILGGGSSKKFDRFQHLLQTETEVLPAQLLNNAGIIGAAVYAREKTSSPKCTSKTLQGL